ncbi:Nematode fatty acid retinoid binding family-containing protein [Strongyloides ratti]|uniref:Nematode fatty acid retinoid binding family-containing protein n=1 Tax=Strongyloides ratti TaxID=34506 RepID=A0A090MZ33_STRRB|nr:Nematode fatty acid retinoid binding family-containing protein [Strongyloides ratti]CEF68234.1 Nematode fatty acid retinoid binding family-containing protein [Strongyloides ratti]
MSFHKKYFYVVFIIIIIIGVILSLAVYDININEELSEKIKEELTWYTPKELVQFDDSLTEEETIILNEYSEGLYKNDSKRHENDILKDASPILYNKLINLFNQLKEKRENLSEEGKNFYISMCREGHFLAKNKNKISSYKLIIKYLRILTTSFNKLSEDTKDELTASFPTIKALTETNSYGMEFNQFLKNEKFLYSIMRILKVLQLIILY